MKERYENRVRQIKESAESSCVDDGNNTIYIDDNEDHHMQDESLFQKKDTEINDQRRIALLSQLSEDHQERLRVLSEVFLKASKNDRPVEVGSILFWFLIAVYREYNSKSFGICIYLSLFILLLWFVGLYLYL